VRVGDVERDLESRVKTALSEHGSR